MPYLKPFLFIASHVTCFKPMSFPRQFQIKTCILLSSHARRPSEFAWLAAWHLHLQKITNRAEQVEAGPIPVQLPSFASPPSPPPRIPSEILHSLHHPNYYSFCNLTMLAYALSLNIIEQPTPKLCQCRNGLWAVGLNEHNLFCAVDVTLIFVTRWSKLMLGTSQHPIQRLTRDVSLGMSPRVCEGDH